MSKALRANLQASSDVKFPNAAAIGEGSLYLMAIETDEVIMINPELSLESSPFTKSNKPFIKGIFWEAYISYDWSWDSPNTTGPANINVNGDFAFELHDESGLDGYDVDDGPISSLVIAWAEDGDSQKVVGRTVSLNGNLSSCEEDEEDEEFEEL